MPVDADIVRFETELNRTKAGLALRFAIHEGRIATAQIRRLERLGGPGRKHAIEGWRRVYIKACDRAAIAIDQLWEEHRWPADAARARDYRWRPRVT